MTQKPDYLYLIISADQRAAKIGRTKRPRDRLSQIQNGNSARLTLYAAIRTTGAAEAALHERLAKFRIGGEWFRHVPMLKAIFCSLEEDEWDAQYIHGRGMTADEVVTSAGFGIRSYLADRVNGLHPDPTNANEYDEAA